MDKPKFIFVAGCNAAGKSTFIRTRLNDLEGFEILMTDVYKSRTKNLAKKAIEAGKNIIIETIFNDKSFKDLIDEARNAGYETSLIVLFLDNIQQSFDRVTFRGMQQSGIRISGSNVKINFNESFKNIATYFFYFDNSDFIYAGNGERNQLIMSFQKGELIIYNTNKLDFPKKFASYSFQKERLNETAYQIINQNIDFKKNSNTEPVAKFKF